MQIKESPVLRDRDQTVSPGTAQGIAAATRPSLPDDRGYKTRYGPRILLMRKARRKRAYERHGFLQA